jgi:hypothetical protein
MNHAKFAETFFHKRFRNQPSGYPIATIAYYGPDDRTATKVAVGILDSRDEVIEMKRWFIDAMDVRVDRMINDAILSFLKEQGVQRVLTVGKIIGCPHEEGVDYPDGAACPQCPYWAKVDRWSGVVKR